MAILGILCFYIDYRCQSQPPRTSLNQGFAFFIGVAFSSFSNKKPFVSAGKKNEDGSSAQPSASTQLCQKYLNSYSNPQGFKKGPIYLLLHFDSDQTHRKYHLKSQDEVAELTMAPNFSRTVFTGCGCEPSNFCRCLLYVPEQDHSYYLGLICMSEWKRIMIII